MSEDIDTIKIVAFQKESEIIVGRCSIESNKIQSSIGQNAIFQERGYDWQKRFWEKPLKVWTERMKLKIGRLAIEITISKKGRLGKKVHSIGKNFITMYIETLNFRTNTLLD